MRIQGANRYVRELATASGLQIHAGSGWVTLSFLGDPSEIGRGFNLLGAIHDALHRRLPGSRGVEQTLFLMGALALGPADLFRNMTNLWGDDDDEDEDDPDSDPDSEITVHRR